MSEQAKNFFDYPHSPFRDDSDFAGLFRHACDLLGETAAKSAAVTISRRAFAHYGIEEEHKSIFVLTVELRLMDFGRLGELPEWLRLLDWHTEKRYEIAPDRSFVSSNGMVCRVVPGAIPPLPPIQVTFLGPPDGSPRDAKRQVVSVSRGRVNKAIPRRKGDMAPEENTEKRVRVTQHEYGVVAVAWPLFTQSMTGTVKCSDILSAVAWDAPSKIVANSVIDQLKKKGVLVRTDTLGEYSRGESRLIVGNCSEPEESWVSIDFPNLLPAEHLSSLAPDAVPNGQPTDDQPEPPSTRTSTDNNEPPNVIAALDQEEERITAALATAERECEEIKVAAEKRCEAIRATAIERLEAIAKTRQLLATPFPF